MIYLIPLAVILVSLGGIFYIVIQRARNMSRAGGNGLVYPDFDVKADAGGESADSGFSLEYFRKMLGFREGEPFLIFVEKFFKKARIRLMKVENWMAGVSKNLHEKRLQKQNPASSSHITDEKSEPAREARRAEEPQDKKGGASFVSSLSDGNGRFDEQYWLDVLKGDPQSVYPYKKLGDIYMAREEFQEARSVFKCVLKIDPGDKEAIAKIEELKGKRTSKK